MLSRCVDLTFIDSLNNIYLKYIGAMQKYVFKAEDIICAHKKESNKIHKDKNL